MEFRILGPLEVHDGQRAVALAGAKQRLLLALLLAEPGRRVSRDVVTEALWPDRATGESVHALDLQVSRLRRAIGAQRLVTEGGGYRVELADGVLDAERFVALVDEARNQRPSAAAVRCVRRSRSGAARRSASSETRKRCVRRRVRSMTRA